MTTQSEAGVPTRSTWQLDPAHTLVEFSGKHMMFTTVKGHFKSVRGTIVLDEADPSRSSVEVEIDTPSLYSGVEYRDTHLKSPDFLDIERHPRGRAGHRARRTWEGSHGPGGDLLRCPDLDQPQRLRPDLEHGLGDRWFSCG